MASLIAKNIDEDKNNGGSPTAYRSIKEILTLLMHHIQSVPQQP